MASDLADASFGVETGARQFGLDFIPVVSERYFLICGKESLQAPAVKRICDVLQSKQFRAEAAKLPGIEVAQAGMPLALEEAFPELRPSLERHGERSLYVVAVRDPGGDLVAALPDEIIAHTPTVAPGETGTTCFRVPEKAGEYPFISSARQHWTAMKGTLEVKARG